ncbi:MAG: hypothetical protein ACRELB_22430, partial [Polyangiaceae bacterium]
MGALAVILACAGVARAEPESCELCHKGIEDIHPGYALTCTDCHGGDPKAPTKDEAHVHPLKPLPGDERVLPRDWDPAYLRFRNPSDLRVVNDNCGGCHDDEIKHLLCSLHGTTSGHLSDGYYENGATRSKTEAFSIFKTPGLSLLPPAKDLTKVAARATIAEHYLDLPRKACMQCHLWSVGRA